MRSWEGVRRLTPVGKMALAVLRPPPWMRLTPVVRDDGCLGQDGVVVMRELAGSDRESSVMARWALGRRRKLVVRVAGVWRPVSLMRSCGGGPALGTWPLLSPAGVASGIP